MLEQIIVLGVLILTLIFFIWGRWRYDLVALMSLLVVTLAGIVPATEAFVGFGHPAVITVAAVLIVSRGLFNSGLVDSIARWMFRVNNRPLLKVTALTGLVAALSGFINDVGALALLMPVAIQMARKGGQPPSLLLMPLAFGSLLGGLLTMIGTPPNIIISIYRHRVNPEPFGMFDYTPVGLGVAIAGVLFISLLGWRFLPRRKGQTSRQELFQIQDYTTELRVPAESPFVSKNLWELEKAAESEITVVGLVRGEKRYLVPSGLETLRAEDTLIIEGDSDALKAVTDAAGLEIAGSKEQLGEETLKSEEISLIETVVRPDSPIVGKTEANLSFRSRYGINLLAVARQGERLRDRLSRIHFQAGDILLLQGPTESLHECLTYLGCLPLAERSLRLGQPRRVLFSSLIFVAAVACVALELVSIQTAFVGAAFLMVIFNFLTPRQVYESIEWPVIILLGAMIPVGQALESTGGSDLIAGQMVKIALFVSPGLALAIMLGGTMLLSNLVNNSAVAVLMAPIAIGLSQGLGVSADPFLMSVAVGASCTFLTPIGHQSNALVFGPGGYRFGDYWRMGLPLSILVISVSTPLILLFWPL